MRIVVLGAGIIGIATAYRLARDGHRVTVIDRQPGPALEASFANAAQIAAALSGPWAAPGVPGQILHWMRRADSPMRFRLKADPAQWLWGLRFLAECRRERFETTFRRMLEFGQYSQRMLTGVKQESGIAYDQLEKGILKLCTTSATVADLADFEAILHRSEIEAKRISVEEAIALEPALEASRDRLAACLHLPTDETGDAHLFARGLADRCAALARFAGGIDFSEAAQAMEAFTEIGPGGHFLGAAHTRAHFESAFWMGDMSDNGTYEQWSAEGAEWQHSRATRRVKQILHDYEPPAMDIAVREALDDFVARRSIEITGESA